METQEIKVATGVLIFKEDKILLIRRQGSSGSGEYAFPGGKLEYNESFQECAKREIFEETNIQITNIKFVNIINSNSYGKHFIVVGFFADWLSGEIKNMEPAKCDYIGWHAINNLPEPFFEHSALILDGYKNNKNFYDKE